MMKILSECSNLFPLENKVSSMVTKCGEMMQDQNQAAFVKDITKTMSATIKMLESKVEGCEQQWIHALHGMSEKMKSVKVPSSTWSAGENKDTFEKLTNLILDRMLPLMKKESTSGMVDAGVTVICELKLACENPEYTVLQNQVSGLQKVLEAWRKLATLTEAGAESLCPALEDALVGVRRACMGKDMNQQLSWVTGAVWSELCKAVIAEALGDYDCLAKKLCKQSLTLLDTAVAALVDEQGKVLGFDWIE